jgi:hypothetical protein
MKITRMEVMGFILMFAWLIKYLTEPLYDYDLFIVGFVLVLVSNAIEVYENIRQAVSKDYRSYVYFVAFYDPSTDSISHTQNHITRHSLEYLMDPKNQSELRISLGVPSSYTLFGITYLGELHKHK